MNFLFPYMARWKAVNWSRYHQIFTLLAESGHNVHIIQAPLNNSTETNFQEIAINTPPNLYIHEVAVNPLIWNSKLPLNKLIKKGYYSFKSIKKAKEIVEKFKIDVLFTYNIPQIPLMKTKSCIKIFDLADDYMAMLEHELGRFNNKLILKIGRSILNKMVEKSDITLSVSKTLLNSITKIDGKKMHIIPNGVSLEEATAGCGAQIREKFKKPVIGFIGAFEYFIDFDLILDTAERLPEYSFLLVGTGREYNAVKNKIGQKNLKNVILTGGVPHFEITKYIDAMDICLNVFKKIRISHGACPIKLFEYLSMKKPVISTRLEEIENNIDDGFLFYADTVDELQNEINNVLTNRQTAEKYAEKGFNIVKTKYQWPSIVNELLSIITENKINKLEQKIEKN